MNSSPYVFPDTANEQDTFLILSIMLSMPCLCNVWQNYPHKRANKTVNSYRVKVIWGTQHFKRLRCLLYGPFPRFPWWSFWKLVYFQRLSMSFNINTTKQTRLYTKCNIAFLYWTVWLKTLDKLGPLGCKTCPFGISWYMCCKLSPQHLTWKFNFKVWLCWSEAL